ncbi:MAG: hypothetical protein ABI791_07630 [Acidobacteriota bacterium]
MNIAERSLDVHPRNLIDPHGLRNESGGFNSDRVRLSKYLTGGGTHFDEVKGLKLNSFILSPSTFHDAAIRRWAPDDSDEEFAAKCDDHNLIEMTPAGNANPTAYVRKIVDKTLSG